MNVAEAANERAKIDKINAEWVRAAAARQDARRITWLADMASIRAAHKALEHPCDTCLNYYPDDDDCGYCEKLEAYWDTAE